MKANDLAYSILMLLVASFILLALIVPRYLLPGFGVLLFCFLISP